MSRETRSCGDFEVDSPCGSSGDATDTRAPASKHTPRNMSFPFAAAFRNISGPCYVIGRGVATKLGSGQGSGAVETAAGRGLATKDTQALSLGRFALRGLGKVWLTRDRTVLAGSRRYPMSSFVYLLLVALPPLFLTTAKIAPPMTRPPNTAMITMGSTHPSEKYLPPNIDTRGKKKVPTFQ